MKLVIDIPDGYKDVLPTIQNGSIACKVVLNAVKNGTSYEERPKGKWIGDTDYESFQGSYEAYKCSICGHSLHWRDYCSNKYNFCPNCGARMEG